jgi:putative flippase GtrA
LRARFTDAQCGFKAVRADVLPELLEAVSDQSWFFDTELLIAAQRRGMRIYEVPVDWVDDPDSRVDVVSTALADLRGVARLALDTPVARFVAIGAASTAAYALLFLLLAGALGSAAASALALALTAVVNTAANRRLTFGIRGRDGLARHQAAGFVVFVLALGLTNGALSVLHDLDRHAPRLLEAVVLVLATLAATVTRYVALSSWVFRRPARPDPVPSLDTQGN